MALFTDECGRSLEASVNSGGLTLTVKEPNACGGYRHTSITIPCDSVQEIANKLVSEGYRGPIPEFICSD